MTVPPSSRVLIKKIDGWICRRFTRVLHWYAGGNASGGEGRSGGQPSYHRINAAKINGSMIISAGTDCMPTIRSSSTRLFDLPGAITNVIKFPLFESRKDG